MGINGQKIKRIELLRPDKYYSAFWMIDFEKLAAEGIRYLIIDVDSTIAGAYSKHVDPRAKETLEYILKEGIMEQACLVSNTVYNRKEPRVRAMAELMKIPYVAAGFFHQKPRALPFLKGLKMMEAKPEETAVIGDQIYTDILGGNKLGMTTILLEPLGKVHWTSILILRRLRESRILRKLGIKLDDVVRKAEEEAEKRIEKEMEEEVEKEIEKIVTGEKRLEEVEELEELSEEIEELKELAEIEKTDLTEDNLVKNK
jgi:uncharacterized protein